MTHECEEAIFDHILNLLEAQRLLLREKLSKVDHDRFTRQSEEIRELIARLNHAEPAGRA